MHVASVYILILPRTVHVWRCPRNLFSVLQGIIRPLRSRYPLVDSESHFTTGITSMLVVGRMKALSLNI